jgi:Na+/H+ antiporter NhaD/arsenite permease-like protein
MEPIQTITTLIFLVTIVLVIVRWIDSVVAALLGVVAMIVAGSMTEVQAFEFVDWNVIAILVSIWLIAGYFGKTGIPQYLADMTLRISRGNVPLFVTLIGALSGFVSMFIDNVVVVLMLPPQMLHSVSGVEFLGFVWHSGRPSSFIILTVTYLVVVLFFYFKFLRSPLAEITFEPGANQTDAGETVVHIKNKRFALVVCGVFILTIIGMSLRQVLGVKLGFIAFSGALFLVLLFELFSKPFRLDPPSLEEMLAELDWKAIGFYVALFALVGGLEHAHILEIVANWLIPYIQSSLLLGASILYWVTAPIVGIVEHDAYILTLLYVIRDLGQSHGINPWPLYWGLVWAGTLGSNLTIAGAPALYVALSMGEREDGRKWSLKEFLSYSVPYVIISLIVCYILMVLVWVLPFM